MRKIIAALMLATALSITPALANGDQCPEGRMTYEESVEKGKEAGWEVANLTKEEIADRVAAFDRIGGQITDPSVADRGQVGVHKGAEAVMYIGFDGKGCALWGIGPMGLDMYLLMETTASEISKERDVSKEKGKS